VRASERVPSCSRAATLAAVTQATLSAFSPKAHACAWHTGCVTERVPCARSHASPFATAARSNRACSDVHLSNLYSQLRVLEDCTCIVASALSQSNIAGTDRNAACTGGYLVVWLLVNTRLSPGSPSRTKANNLAKRLTEAPSQCRPRCQQQPQAHAIRCAEATRRPLCQLRCRPTSSASCASASPATPSLPARVCIHRSAHT